MMKLVDVPVHTGPMPALDAEPAVRARAMKDSIAFLAEFAEGFDAKIAARLDPGVLAAIDRALPTDWLPGPITRQVVDAVVEELGEQRAPELWCELMHRRLVKSPMLRGLIEVLNRIGGTSPRTFLKALPRGWANAYRDFGQPEILSSEAHHAEVVWRSVPDYLFVHRQHWIAVQGALKGLVKAGGAEGRVALSFDPDAHEVRGDLSW